MPYKDVEKRIARQHDYHLENQEHRNAYQRNLREARRAAGLCLSAGCPDKAMPGNVRCPKHTEDMRHATMRYKYRLKQDKLLALLQQSACAICGSRERLHIDHNHNTGQVRERLCQQCNQGIGNFKENPDLMLKAIAYVEKHNANHDTSRIAPASPLGGVALSGQGRG